MVWLWCMVWIVMLNWLHYRKVALKSKNSCSRDSSGECWWLGQLAHFANLTEEQTSCWCHWIVHHTLHKPHCKRTRYQRALPLEYKRSYKEKLNIFKYYRSTLHRKTERFCDGNRIPFTVMENYSVFSASPCTLSRKCMLHCLEKQAKIILHTELCYCVCWNPLAVIVYQVQVCAVSMRLAWLARKKTTVLAVNQISSAGMI